MAILQDYIAALSDNELKRLSDLLDTIAMKMKVGASYSSEIYSLSDEFKFSEADLLDTDSLISLSNQEGKHRWQDS